MPIVETSRVIPGSLADIASPSLNTVANNNPISGIPVIYRVSVPAAAGTTNVTITNQTRILDAWFAKTNAGGAGDTLAIQNAANRVSDLMSTNVADQTVVRAATWDDAFYLIGAGGTLRIETTGAADVSATVYVLGIRV
jgi:hypothetical protein